MLTRVGAATSRCQQQLARGGVITSSTTTTRLDPTATSGHEAGPIYLTIRTLLRIYN